MSETKNEKFMRVVTKRLGNALEDLRKIKQCSSANYEFTEEQAGEIVRLLTDGVADVAVAYNVVAAPIEAQPAEAQEEPVKFQQNITVAQMEDMIEKLVYKGETGKDEVLEAIRDAHLNHEPEFQ